jgi:type II restriction enzyme
MKINYTPKLIPKEAITRRINWINEINNTTGNFVNDFNRIEGLLKAELKTNTEEVLLEHIRLCGDIPELYGHDTSEEKLYSKYSDALLAESFSYIGFKAIVYTERGDSADVEARDENYSFVADAKCFRISRTAKNQKDFKVQAMDTWKKGHSHALLICPLYQMPTKSSQIYQQAAQRNVAILTYSHLAILILLVKQIGGDNVRLLIRDVFSKVETMSPSKLSKDYWTAVNSVIFSSSNDAMNLWENEKLISSEGIKISKMLASAEVYDEQERIKNMTHDEAIAELLELNRISSRLNTIDKVEDNEILNFV